MSTTFTESVTLERVNCGKCGGVFALNNEYMRYQRASAGEYHCPYCRMRWIWTQSEADQLRNQLSEKCKEVTASKCEAMRERQLREEEEVLRMKAERKLKRVDRGVCPCCNRTFSNLARHMATKHSPDTADAK